MTFNTNIELIVKISNRSKAILSTPKFNIATNTNDDLETGYHFIISSDKNLTVKYKKSTDEMQNLVMESMAILLNQRTNDRILKLTFKEFESFLRDDNSTEAFDSDNRTFVENEFASARKFLIISWLKSYFSSNTCENFQTFIGKNRIVDQVFDKIIGDFDLKNDYRYELMEHEYIYFYKNPKVESCVVEEALEIFFSEFFGVIIKLVAVKG